MISPLISYDFAAKIMYDFAAISCMATVNFAAKK